MGRRNQRVLAVAARSGRLGCVILDDGDLVIWDTSEKGATSPKAAVSKLLAWVQELKPNVIVTENPDAAGHKRGQQIPILKALADASQDLDILNLVVRRERRFRNVYREARHFAEMCPDLAPFVPTKPPIWGSEPYNLVFFEALALARDAGLLKSIADSYPPQIGNH